MTDSVASRELEGFDVPTLRRSRTDQRWDRARHALLAGWVLMLVTIPFTGERTANWSDIRDLAAAGKVHTVRIDNELPATDLSSSRVTIHWRHGPFRYVTIVRETLGHNNEPLKNPSNSNVTAILDEPPSTRLRESQPGLEITRRHGDSDYNNVFLGFSSDWPYGIGSVLLWFVGLMVLLMGPQPWRATRWAWFWWVTNPFGVAAFLVLAGPTPVVPKPDKVTRRLTGGWSFLLAVAPTVSFTIFGLHLHL